MTYAKTIADIIPNQRNQWNKLKELLWKFQGKQINFSEEGTFGKKVETFKFPDNSSLRVEWFDVDHMEPYDYDIKVKAI